MKPDRIKDEISKLDLSEKLLLVEEIWDAIAISNSDIPMPDWQKQELDKRFKEFKAEKSELHDWRAVHAAIRTQNK